MMLRFPLYLILVIGLAGRTDAASVHTETFGAPDAADTGLLLGAGGWDLSGGEARIDFASTAPLAIPDLATLIPNAIAFRGDYAGVGVLTTGFRLHRTGEAPSHLYLELTSGDAVFQHALPIPPGGQWTTYAVTLDPESPGAWSVMRAGTNDFVAALGAVDQLAIKIRRAGAGEATVRIDDVYLDGAPEAALDLAAGSGGVQPVLSWDTLQPGAVYTVEASPTPRGPWYPAMTLTATGRLDAIMLPTADAAPVHFFRLRGP
jgi:hypothetical protein